MDNWSRLHIGQGWDVHRLVTGKPLILGGVTIPFDKGALGHSDADVLLHAIIDALLGAAALGDIGQHFPNNARYKDIDSRCLLRETYTKITERGLSIVNIDTSIVLQRPKLARYIPLMRGNIAADLNIQIGQVNIKAKTYEALGPVGNSDAVEAQAISLLRCTKD